MKASFFKRLAAYFIDVTIVTIIAGIISVGFTSEKYEEASKKYNELTDQYSQYELSIKEYLEQSAPVIYDMQESSVIVSIITLTSSIAYFVVFQYLSKGQTIAKKLLGLKVKENGKDPSIKSLIIRTALVNSLLTTTLSIILIYILNRNNYYLGYFAISILELIFVFITALFVLYRKDKLGLHDIIAHTEVIDERGN